MKNRIKNFIIGIAIATTIMFPLVSVIQPNPSKVEASLLCDIFPFLNNIKSFGISDTCVTAGSTTVVKSTGNFISFALNLVFVGLIILAVFIIIRSAIKYIQSEGNEGKIVEAQKAIKAVFVGIGVLIVGIVGIFIVIAFFNASGATNADTSKSTDVQNFLNQGK